MEKYLNKIINADCLDILKQLPDKSVDLVLTDPPYGIGFGTFNRTNKLKNGKRVKANKYKNSDWDSEIPHDEIFKEIIRVSKNQIIWGGNYFPELWKQGCRGFIFWKKNNPCLNFGAGEFAWTSFDTNCKCYDYNYYGNIEGNTKAEEKIHPTQKPIEIMKKCLVDFSKENDIVLDCFSGSGTTAIACHRLKRNFICVEKDYDYWKASCKRLEDEQKQGTLF
ncbi:MAG: site-specific DNA-methyltransferase [Bacteroidales bacterium]|nr:site-specific DNA-methyltransferase [Candidatus Scybalousia scybalohippi]